MFSKQAFIASLQECKNARFNGVRAELPTSEVPAEILALISDSKSQK